MSTGPLVDDGPRDLPDTATTFVGREVGLAEVAGLLASSRLVTVTGPAGMGKTRLAVETAEAIADDFPDGVHLVELATVDDPDEVAAAVASALTVPEGAGTGRTLALVDALRHRRSLLVLDTCEHVTDACAALAERVLRACPDVAILATSQLPLGADGEQVWRIPPLELPGPDADRDVNALVRSPAVRLFVDRARRRRPDFTLTQDAAPSVAEICRRLDGMPLAIELAAGQVDRLTPGEIAARLDERFLLLDRGTDAPRSRHETLQAALDWSHSLLSDAEQALFRRLAVFVGGADLPVARDVCADGEVDRDRFFVLLRGLVARSLALGESFAGGPRCGLLETMRRYALDRLIEAGEADRFRDRHADWCRQLAERAEPELEGGDQQTWLQRLDTEHDNLRAALEHTSTHPERAPWWPDLVGSLVLFWSMRGHLTEGLHWVETALRADGIGSATRAKLRWGASFLAHVGGDVVAAERWARGSLDLADEAGDVRVRARSLNVLGALDAYKGGDQEHAVELLGEAVDLARQAGDSWCEIGALVALGYAALLANEPDEARRRFERCLIVAERHPRSAGHRMHALTGLGRAAIAQGDHDVGERSLREALDLARRVGLRFPGATALHHLGRLATERGEYERARRLLLEALAVDRSVGASSAMSHSLGVLGRVARVQGDLDGATPLLYEARRLAAADGMEAWEARVLAELAAVARARRKLGLSRSLLHEALGLADEASDKAAAARVLEELGRLARLEGDLTGAAWWQRRALRLYHDLGQPPGLVDCLEDLAALLGAQGRPDRAARLFGAAAALREAHGYARAPVDQPGYEHDVEASRAASSEGAFDAAWQEGAGWSVDTAMAEAGRGGGGDRPEHGWAALTDRERDVARLVGQGLTNREVAERLYVSVRTVQSHLSRVYAKLDISSREDLAEQLPATPSDPDGAA